MGWKWARDLEGVRDLEGETESPRCCPRLGGGRIGPGCLARTLAWLISAGTRQIARTICEISLRGHMLSLPRRFAALGLELIDQVPTTWCVGKFLADDQESWTMVKYTLFHGRTNIFVNHTSFNKKWFHQSRPNMSSSSCYKMSLKKLL